MLSTSINQPEMSTSLMPVLLTR
ncbi:hypothetical protein Goarm_018119 [Gossypium armourianum]|uniref:Uncharacterized protein n=1 Tax=Gossypium armourianum TaxID=34283 RepID=A0A7J9IGJ5_9ROSI|nr:hypothetical protein [Gossypium armourianum]